MKKILFFFLSSFFSISFAGNITVGTISYPVDTLAHYKFGPGSYYTALQLIDATKPLRVFFLEVDATNPFISFKTVLGKDSTVTPERPSDMAKRKTKEGAMYIGGTNADFFVTVGQVGLPVAGCMVNGEVALIPNSRPDIAFDRNLIPFIGTKVFAGNVSAAGISFPIANINTTRSTNQLILYNSLNGKFTHTNSSGTEVLVQLIDPKWDVNKILKAKVISVVSGVGNMTIPVGSAVLSGHGTAQTYLNTLNVNDEIDLNLGITIGGSEKPSLTDMVGGDRLILQNGQVTDNDWVELNPRTAMGYSADKSKIYFCVVDGRSLLSVGVGTKQLADIMKSAGAYTAINLDGGGSSCMYVKEFNVMNHGSDGVERAVGNGIFAVSSAPTDNTIAEIKSYTRKIKLPRYGVFLPKFIGYNQYGTLIDKDVKGVVLNCSSDLGEIKTDGSFVASGTTGGMLTATYNNITTQVEIELVSSAEIALRLDSVLIDNRTNYNIQVQSTIGINTMEVLPAALTWTVKDPTICTADNGELKGLQNGSTLVIGTLGDFKDTLKVKVEIPTSGRMISDEFLHERWTLEASNALNAVMNAENLPASWAHGSAVNFVYTATRAPFIKLSRDIQLYSLPDTMKVMLNLGSIAMSKAIMSLKANNSTQSVTKEISSFTQNADSEISVTVSDLFNASDIAIYPVTFNYLNFYLGSLTANQSYTLALKEITLCYKGIKISGMPSTWMSAFSVYPNPVRGNELNIRFADNITSKVTVELFTVLGQHLRSQQFNNNLQQEIVFPIGDLKSGTYFLQVSQGEKTGSVKIMVR